MKALTDAQYALKAAVRRAVKMAGGPNAACDVVRVDAPRLSRYGNNEDPSFAPADVLFELDRAAGSPVILRALADLHGFDLIQRDCAADQLAKDVTALAGELALEAGEAVSTALRAKADGKLTNNEVKAVHDALADVDDVVVRFQSVVRSKVVGGQG